VADSFGRQEGVQTIQRLGIVSVQGAGCLCHIQQECHDAFRTLPLTMLLLAGKMLHQTSPDSYALQLI
jgi:hypothetical protein